MTERQEATEGRGCNCAGPGGPGCDGSCAAPDAFRQSTQPMRRLRATVCDMSAPQTMVSITDENTGEELWRGYVAAMRDAVKAIRDQEAQAHGR